MIWFAFIGGLVVGALTVVLLSKNNKNTIAKIRSEVLAVAAKGEAEVKKVIDKY
jgi:hypothetical protein